MIPDILNKTVVTTLAMLASSIITIIIQKFYGKIGQIFETGTFKDRSKSASKGRSLFIFSNLSILFLLFYYQFLGPHYSQLLLKSNIDTLIYGHRWVSYDPVPHDSSDGTKFNLSQISKEISLIKSAGFDGVITFSCQKFSTTLIRTAKEKDLKTIIGIWNPLDSVEVARAISLKKYADAYCVGHDGLGTIYSFKQLSDTIQKVRFLTGKPVSTSEYLGKYIRESCDKRLMSVGDWLFPDVHISIQNVENASKNAQDVIQWAKELTEGTKDLHKPILLKMVAYPIKGFMNSSIEEQRLFYSLLLESQAGVMPKMPLNVTFSAHSAFDLPWAYGWPLYECCPFSGLINNDGTRRPAAKIIMERLH
jgi:hypothetical protein